MVVQHPFSEFLVLFRLGIAANKVACRYASALHYLHYCYINYYTYNALYVVDNLEGKSHYIRIRICS